MLLVSDVSGSPQQFLHALSSLLLHVAPVGSVTSWREANVAVPEAFLYDPSFTHGFRSILRGASSGFGDTHSVGFGEHDGMMMDVDAVECPDCGALLIVNLRGYRQFICGRHDIYLGSDRHSRNVVGVLKPCGTSELAARLLKAERCKFN